MEAYAKLRERKSGEIRYYYEWRRQWDMARLAGDLAARGWPDSWAEFEKRLLPCEAGAACGARIRKRKPGGGRKPNPDKMLVRQICLTREQAEAVKQAASAAGISQSAWIREAIKSFTIKI